MDSKSLYQNCICFIRTIIIILFVLLLTTLSIYAIWGWLTLSDIKKYCDEHSLNYYDTLESLVQGVNTSFERNKDGEIIITKDHSEVYKPLYRVIIPFERVTTINKVSDDYKEQGIHYFQGAILEPFMAFTESTSNALFSLAIGYLIGVLIILTEMLTPQKTTYLRALFRPILGALGSVLCYIIILSGGALIWNQVSGVSGLSLGVISAIGSIYVNRFTKYLTITV